MGTVILSRSAAGAKPALSQAEGNLVLCVEERLFAKNEILRRFAPQTCPEPAEGMTDHPNQCDRINARQMQNLRFSRNPCILFDEVSLTHEGQGEKHQ